jgi:hypothetical protein
MISVGVRRGFYNRSLVRSYLTAYEAQLYENFLRQEPPAGLTSYFWDVALDEVRQVFERPPFVPEPPLTAAARLARSLQDRAGVTAAAEPDHGAERIAAYAHSVASADPRAAARLRFLLDRAKRPAIDGG